MPLDYAVMLIAPIVIVVEILARFRKSPPFHFRLLCYACGVLIFWGMRYISLT